MTSLSQEQKHQIISLIEIEKQARGTYDAVATFCGVSPTAINLMKANKYETKGDDAWLQVGTRLGLFKDWLTYETQDCRSIAKVLSDSRTNSTFMRIVDNGGIGKTTGLKHYQAKNGGTGNINYIRCLEWGKREFMAKLCQALGINISKGYKSPNELIEIVIEHYQQKAALKPQLLIDEANKLKRSAKLYLIPIFNECEDFLSVVLTGPDDLDKEIEAGVKNGWKGYDEIDSRFGRRSIKLIGSTEAEVIAICKLNGYDNETRIKEVFEASKPIRTTVTVQGKPVVLRVIKDLRRIKQMVKLSRNQSNTTNYAN
jgi:AAA domain